LKFYTYLLRSQWYGLFFYGPWRDDGKGIAYIRCINYSFFVIIMIIDGYPFLSGFYYEKRENKEYWKTIKREPDVLYYFKLDM